MSALGKTYKSKADNSQWRVTGYDEASSQFILSPVEFGSPIAKSPDDLRRDFVNVRGATVPDASDDAGAWRKIGERFRRSADRSRSDANGLLTVEEVFAGAAQTRAEELAQDEDALADYAVGLLPVSPAVATALDAIVAERARLADAEAAA
jgi:hypothetical protein